MSPFEGPLRLEDMRQPARVVARGHFVVQVVGLPFGGLRRSASVNTQRSNLLPRREISTRIIDILGRARNR